MLILMEHILDLVALCLFLVIGCLLQAYQIFLTFHQQRSFWSYSCFKNLNSLEWWSKSFLVERILFICSVWLYGILFYNHFGCSELILRKVWRSVFFLNVLACNLLFLICISESRNGNLSFKISYSNLIEGCFVFNSFKKFSRSVLLPVHIKSIVYKPEVYKWRCLHQWVDEFSFEVVQKDVSSFCSWR